MLLLADDCDDKMVDHRQGGSILHLPWVLSRFQVVGRVREVVRKVLPRG